MATSRVLLVDDVRAFRTLVAAALRMRGGFEVVAEASDGRSAIAAAARFQPDVVVLDLGLPDVAGTEVIRLVRESAPACKIVVFTGFDVDLDLDAQRSVEGFVRKDSDVQLLIDVLVDQRREHVPVGARLRLAHDVTSAGRARGLVQELCRDWGIDDEVVDDALLVVSELVTNAFVHAESEAELRVFPGKGLLRIEVADSGAAGPDPQLATDDDEHGRGLLLVSVLSAAWGTEPTGSGGKVVWAEVPTTRIAARAS
jgi:CheY-like chemotaxis protein